MPRAQMMFWWFLGLITVRTSVLYTHMELGVKEVFEKYDLSTSLGFLLDKENNDVSKIDATFNFLNSHIGIISKQKKNRRY